MKLEPSGLPPKMVAISQRLAGAGLSHAFGGALALAWCTEQARATIDLDVNVFVRPQLVEIVLAALPRGVLVGDADRVQLERDGQARLWWDTTPVDLFLSTTDFHDEVAERIRWEPFAGTQLPFLGCHDLAVFKAFFNRTKDWADLEAMHAAASLDVHSVVGVLTAFLGADDERIERLLTLGQ